jgi:DNA-binding GntR family transcriptional regulator
VFIKIDKSIVIKMGNKKTTVYEKLKKKIIDGSLQPGSPINENEYAKDLKVSKTPIREALRQLERERLVENIPGRGSTVANISFQDIREIFEIREIIECGAVKRVAMTCDVEEISERKKEVEFAVTQMEKSYETLFKEIEDIQLFLITYHGNKKLSETYQGLLDHIKRIRFHFGRKFSQQRYAEILTEHIEVLDALIAGDENRSEKAIQNHLRNAEAYILGLS